MKLALLVLISAALLAPQAQGSGTAAPARISVLASDGSETKLTESKDQTVKFWLQQLVLSALYRDVVFESSLDEWQRIENALPRIECAYSKDTKIAIPEKRTLEFDRVLVPLRDGGYPDFIYLRQGNLVLRLAKFDPWVFQKLMVESGLLPPDKLTAPRFLF